MSISAKLKTLGTALVSDPAWVLRRITGRFKPPLFSYQMGKVGSSSIKHTIEERYRVFHCHTQREFEINLGIVNKRDPCGMIDLITATRDPIGREISAFFQNITAMHHGYGVGAREDVLKMDVGELIDIFRERWANHPRLPDTTIWFDRAFLPATGINIYDHAFDRERGWTIFRHDRWRVLVTRFEDINRNYVEAINAYLGERFGPDAVCAELRSANLSEKKWYSELMREFKSRITFTPGEIEELYSSPYCAHFYTPGEIETMKSKWKTGERP
jgi:hypothetical protein